MLLAGLLAGAALSAPAAEPARGVCRVELRAYPGKDPAMWDGLYAASNGHVYSALISEAESAHLYVYDPAQDANVLLYDMAEFLGERGKGIRTSGKIHNKPVEDDEGNIYFVTINNGAGPRSIDFNSWRGGHWFKYDPKRKHLEVLGLVDHGTGLYPLAIDKKRKRLLGIGLTGYLYRLDLTTRTTRNLGRVAGWDVCRDIFCDDEGNVFGSFPVGRVWRYDARTEQVRDLSIQMPYDPTIWPTQLRNPMIDRSCDWRAVEWDPVGKVAYGVTCGSASILFRFDPHAGPEGRFTTLAKMCDTAFLESGRKDIPYSTLAFAVDSPRQRVYFAPSARAYALDAYVETFGSRQPHHLIMYDVRRQQRVDLGAMQAADGRRVFGCEAASVAPDGTVYLCGQAEVAAEKQERRQEIASTAAGQPPLALHLVIYKPQAERK